LPAFQAAYDNKYPPDRTLDGQARQRQAGAGAQGKLPSLADKLLFIVVYQKTHPLQTLHGLQCNVSQSPTHYWLHRLWPVLQHALRDMGQAPERDASRVAHSPLAREGTPDVAMDGTERRRQRPTDATQHKAHDSGKKKTPTDKHIVLVNETTSTVLSLGPTVVGKTHDKQAADEAQIAYPVHATLDKDTGFQGDEPEGVLSRQPKKTARPGLERGGAVPQSPHLQCACGGGKRACGGQTVSDGQRCLAPDHRRLC